MFSDHLRELLSFLVLDSTIGEVDKVASMNANQLLRFKFDDFIDTCKRKRKAQLRDNGKELFRKFLDEAKPVVTSVLINNEMVSPEQPFCFQSRLLMSKRPLSFQDTTTTTKITTDLLSAFTRKFKDLAK